MCFSYTSATINIQEKKRHIAKEGKLKEEGILQNLASFKVELLLTNPQMTGPLHPTKLRFGREETSAHENSKHFQKAETHC